MTTSPLIDGTCPADANVSRCGPGRGNSWDAELTYDILRPLRLVHSTLCGRVLLNLRKAAARSATDISSDQLGIRHWQVSLAVVSPLDERCEPEADVDSDSTVEWHGPLV